MVSDLNGDNNIFKRHLLDGRSRSTMYKPMWYNIRNYTTLLFMVDLLTVHPSNQFTVARTEKIENLDVQFSMWRKYS